MIEMCHIHCNDEYFDIFVSVKTYLVVYSMWLVNLQFLYRKVIVILNTTQGRLLIMIARHRSDNCMGCLFHVYKDDP